MATANHFLTTIRHQPPALGVLVTLGSPEVAELLSLGGFDWLMIDLEHSPITLATAQHMVQATRPPCSVLLRLPENSPAWIKQALDTGADGIVVPMVNSAFEAEAAVRAAKYPPLGTRGVGIARAQGYGSTTDETLRTANAETAVIIQIEHANGVAAIDDTLSVSGIDGVLIGPYDLSGSLNHLGHIGHPAVQKAINRVKHACASRSIPVGIFSIRPEAIAQEIAAGGRFMLIGSDTQFMAGAARQALDLARRPTPAHVTRQYKATYTDPIRLRQGERVTLGRIDTEYPGWRWCMAQDGREGWVPMVLLGPERDGTALALVDYDAIELSVEPGDALLIHRRLDGWLWVSNSRNETGWIPDTHAEPVFPAADQGATPQ